MPNRRWSSDLVSDLLTDGQRFLIVTVFDDCTRECLTLVADTSSSGVRVARDLTRLSEVRGRPQEPARSYQPASTSPPSAPLQRRVRQNIRGAKVHAETHQIRAAGTRRRAYRPLGQRQGTQKPVPDPAARLDDQRQNCRAGRPHSYPIRRAGIKTRQGAGARNCN